MPHQCTDCGRTFADGSKEMLSGCPDCGGNKFQFQPDGVDDPDPDAEPPDPPERAGDGVTRAVGSAATAVRDMVSSDPPEPDPGPEPAPDSGPATPQADTPQADADAADATADADATAGEDAAQASARSDVVPMEELPSDAATPEPDGEDHPTPVLDEHSETAKTAQRTDRPDLADLREELNDQFESIRVLEPGQYELNLMELYDREEYIIALQEDGKYTIQVPERWKDA
jgi:predicted  nucleic acid-binding Zn-ribbon protein